MNNLQIALAFGIGLNIAGCASTPDALVNISIGMSKAEAGRILGQPQSVSSQAGTEYFTYSYCVDKCLAPPIARVYVPFFVRFRSGVVESFGRVGDFDSTKVPTNKVEVERRDTILQDSRIHASGDMYSELKKLKDLFDSGIITDTEFFARKKKILEN